MKKTLITLAAFAMASVASAATLDFTNLTGESSIIFDQPVWNNTTNDWTGSPSNTLTLKGETIIDSAVKTISNGTATVTYTNDVYDLFQLHDVAQGTTHNGPYLMSAGTINFGTDGSLKVDTQSGGLTLQGMRMTLTATLVLEIETMDAALVGTTVLMERTLMSSDDSAIWYRGMSGNSYTFTATGSNGESVTNMTGTGSDSGLTKTISENDAFGSYQIYNKGDYDITLAYVAKYVAAPTSGTESVPEPTTATLSLLALAGLAARRRRK